MSSNDFSKLVNSKDKIVTTFWDDKIHVEKFTQRGDRVYMTVVDTRGNMAAAVMSQKNLKDLISNLQEMVINND